MNCNAKRKVLIVEDNVYSMNMLEKIIMDISSSTLCYKAGNINEAYSILHSVDIDLFLVDIILDTATPGDISGIHLVQEIRAIDRYKFAPVIFITSVEDPKLYAYEHLHSYGYIVKPYPVEETKRLIVEALEYGNNAKDKIIYLKQDGILYAIKENEIIFFESKAHILTVYTRKEKLHFHYKTCNEVLSRLNGRIFVKCSRCSVLNMSYISNIDIVNGYAALECDGKTMSVKLGKRYIKDIFDRL